jgi:hypothetical protein
VLERFEVVEVLRRLDEGELRSSKYGRSAVRKRAVGTWSASRTPMMSASICASAWIEVAGLGVLVGRPRQVASTERLSQFADVIAAPVIEHPRLVLRLERDAAEIVGSSTSGGSLYRSGICTATALASSGTSPTVRPVAAATAPPVPQRTIRVRLHDARSRLCTSATGSISGNRAPHHPPFRGRSWLV